MAEVFVGKTSEFDEEDDIRKIVSVEGREVVVFKRKNRFYAFENTCLHSGGPVGEGMIIGKVEAVLDENRNILMEKFSDEEIHMVCPWHGWEFNIDSGACAGDPRRKLRKYEAVQREDRLYVID